MYHTLINRKKYLKCCYLKKCFIVFNFFVVVGGRHIIIIIIIIIVNSSRKNYTNKISRYYTTRITNIILQDAIPNISMRINYPKTTQLKHKVFEPRRLRTKTCTCLPVIILLPLISRDDLRDTAVYRLKRHRLTRARSACLVHVVRPRCDDIPLNRYCSPSRADSLLRPAA